MSEPEPPAEAPAPPTESAAGSQLPRDRDHPIEVKARSELVRMTYSGLVGVMLSSLALWRRPWR